MAIRFSIRGRTEHKILMGKPAAVRDIYEALEFHKKPDIRVKETDNMTIKQIAKRSGTNRQNVYGILEKLQDLGMIKIRKLSKRGLYQFRLVHYGDDFLDAKKASESEVMKFQQNGSTDVEFEAKVANIPE